MKLKNNPTKCNSPSKLYNSPPNSFKNAQKPFQLIISNFQRQLTLQAIGMLSKTSKSKVLHAYQAQKDEIHILFDSMTDVLDFQHEKIFGKSTCYLLNDNDSQIQKEMIDEIRSDGNKQTPLRQQKRQQNKTGEKRRILQRRTSIQNLLLQDDKEQQLQQTTSIGSAMEFSRVQFDFDFIENQASGKNPPVWKEIAEGILITFTLYAGYKALKKLLN